MRYDTIIFDLDGTLLDTLQDLGGSVNMALAMNGLPQHPLQKICGFVGNGVRKLIERSAGFGPDDPRYAGLFNDFQTYYAAHCNDSTRPYPGIVELVSELKSRGFKLAVVSNKEDREVRILADKYFPGMFTYTIGERPGISRKPAPDSLLQTISDLKTDLRHAVYIGDSEVDVQTARNADVDLIAVTWGFRTRERLAEEGATTFIDSPNQMLSLI
ncbi:MAG: HAD-IA family hydrolase [Mailhella sp.]|nr:HAD-IA family hydrolase [Mailhella sp.]